jgi:hypothetical protein
MFITASNRFFLYRLVLCAFFPCFFCKKKEKQAIHVFFVKKKRKMLIFYEINKAKAIDL